MRNKTIFVLYEVAQVGRLEKLWDERPEERVNSIVVPLSLDIELVLKERGMVFSSGLGYKQPVPKLLEIEDQMMDTFFAALLLQRFKYRGVALPTTFKFMFRIYLQRVWYYGSLLNNVVKDNPHVHRLVVFTPNGVVTSTAGGLANREVNVVIDCAKQIAKATGVTLNVIHSLPPDTLLGDLKTRFRASTHRVLSDLLFKIWNKAMSIIQQPKRPRLVISDYWRNIGSTIELLTESECIFLDRKEIRNIDWRTLIRHRMRFVHSQYFLTRTMRTRVREAARGFAREWHAGRSLMPLIFAPHGLPLDELLLRAIDDLVLTFEKLLGDIEGTYALYDRVQPDVILLRASVSGQTHFSVLPLVAKNCHIPSLELQHGLEHLGPGSLSREHAAEYMAVYGPIVKKELVTLGYVSEKVIPIGSPRFDYYRGQLLTETTENTRRRPTLLCIAPDIKAFEIFDSYSVKDFFDSVARSVESIAGIHVIIKIRSGSTREGLIPNIIADAFCQESFEIVSDQSLAMLFAQADVVISCLSTAVLEALQCGKPVIIPALTPTESEIVHFHFSTYSDAGALRIAIDQTELTRITTELFTHPQMRKDMQGKARTFLASNYCFDGKASERAAELIAKLVRERDGGTSYANSS